MTARKSTTDDAGVVPGTDAPAVNPVADSKTGAPAPEPEIAPEGFAEPEAKSQEDFENVEINRYITEYGRHDPNLSTFGKGGAQSHDRDSK